MTAEHAAAAGGEVVSVAIKAQNPTLDEAWQTIAWWERTADHWRNEALKGYALRDSLPAREAADRHAHNATAADTVLATARRLCCGDNPAPEHNARADHSQRMAFAEELARAVRGS